MQRQQKITLGEMRSVNGPTRLIVYCADYRCAHSVVVDADRCGDEVRLSEPKVTCKACGRRGADVGPLFERARIWLRPGVLDRETAREEAKAFAKAARDRSK